MSLILNLMVVGTLFPDEDRWQVQKVKEGATPDAQAPTSFELNLSDNLPEVFYDNT